MEKQLFRDCDFKNGFTVCALTHYNGYVYKGDIKFPCSGSDAPAWTIDPWYSKHCLWDERIKSDPYTISDGITKTLIYNPKDSSLSMRLNACKVYEGSPSRDELWPHLLLEQKPLSDFFALPAEEQRFYCLDADDITLGLDVRMPDYKPTTNPEGINACQFMAYIYLQLKDKKNFIWFGINLFDDRGMMDTYWHIDTVGTEMIYLLSTEKTFGSRKRSLNRFKPLAPVNGWTPVRVSLIPYIEEAIENANRENTFGRRVSRSDFYIRGTNIGFEIHGNIDCTIDIRNYKLITEIK